MVKKRDWHSSWGCHRRGGAWLGKSAASGTASARRTCHLSVMWWEPGREELQKAANNSLEVYVKIGLCSTPIDFESLKHNYQCIICSTTEATFGFGPGGNLLTGSRVSLFSENAQRYSKSWCRTHISLCYVSEKQLWGECLMEKAKIIHFTNTDTGIRTFWTAVPPISPWNTDEVSHFGFLPARKMIMS